jgi:NAD(P)-dependent dehydrogenase (short-subunit alcohol dehydrogenase family)
MSTSKTVIVSGGTFGLGQAITVELARRGYHVVAFGLMQPQVSSTAQGADALRAELAQLGCSADILEADVSDAQAVAAVVSHAVSRNGTVHGLVNNAAIGPLGTVLDTDESLFERILDVNLKGTYLASRAVLPHMIRSGGGAIVNIGSGAGYGKPNMAAYSASKAGIVGLSMAMAYDHFHDHVRVNVAIPGGGGILSGMSVGRFGGDTQAFLGKPAPGTVAGRPATGRDLAQAVAFLLSNESEAITGTVIDVGCFSHQGGPVGPKPFKESV